jgi:putative endonuclease
MASKKNGTLYTGVTSDIINRTIKHKYGTFEGFTSQHNCTMLVWYEIHETMETAIAREKQIKGGSRKRKLALIEAENPQWLDLYNEIIK